MRRWAEREVHEQQPLMRLRSSLNTARSVKPLAAAYFTIFFSGRP